ncbi:hypothetical protein N7461_000977 [Penicillium sp. DV-2018c]|nr:hypothetical protein N7461_000977 [Penicillium sp. DV-2018c]
MARPLLSPSQYRQLHQAFSPRVHTLRRNGTQTLTKAINTQPNIHTKRTFHTTPNLSAFRRPSPRASRMAIAPKPDFVTKEGLGLDSDDLAVHYFTSDVQPSLAAFGKWKVAIYKDEYYQTLRPAGVSLETFDRVLQEVIRASHSKDPTANTVRAISVDVDALYRIAKVLDFAAFIPNARGIYDWARSACARAGSPRAIVDTIALRQTSTDIINYTTNTELIAKLKDLALRDEFPPAIMLYTQILIYRGEHAEAANLLKTKIIPYIKPTYIPPNPWEDITLGERLDPPLRMLSLVVEKTHGMEGLMEAMRQSAKEYADPIALTDLAILHMEKKDWDIYEMYMGTAAMGGHAPACLYMANFYYKIFQGEVPPKPKVVADREKWLGISETGWSGFKRKISKWVDRQVNPEFSSADYRKHAMDWYEVALEMGSGSAGLVWAILLRQDGLYDYGKVVFNLASRKGIPDTVPKKALVELEHRWDDVSFEPGLPAKLMGLR